MTDLTLPRKDHNQPPADPIADRLAEEFAGLLDERAEVELLAAALPLDPNSDEEVAEFNAFAARAQRLAIETDKAHERAKAPYLEGGRAVDGFFAFRNDVRQRRERMMARCGRYLRAKADAEAAERRRLAAEVAAAAAAARQEAEALAAQAAAERLAAEVSQAQAADPTMNREAIAHDRRADHAEEQAALALKDAAKIEKQAERQATAAESGLLLSRTAGGGSASKVHEVWAYRITDPAKLIASLGPLGSFLVEAAVQQALERVCAGYDTIQRDVPGVDFYKTDKVKSTALRR